MRISDWSSDVCSSDLTGQALRETFRALGDVERILTRIALRSARPRDLGTLRDALGMLPQLRDLLSPLDSPRLQALVAGLGEHDAQATLLAQRSEEHTSELQSLMRLSYAVFCLTK